MAKRKQPVKKAELDFNFTVREPMTPEQASLYLNRVCAQVLEVSGGDTLQMILSIPAGKDSLRVTAAGAGNILARRGAVEQWLNSQGIQEPEPPLEEE